MPHTLTISGAIPGGPGGPALELRQISGTESLSTLFNYRLELATPDVMGISPEAAANVDFKSMVGKEVTVTLELDGKLEFVGKGKREISGIVTRARFIRLENRRGIYEAILEPWLTLAQRSSNYRIFQNKTAIDIIKEVLGTYGFVLEVRTSASYPLKAYCVQYGETDFAFVSRLMEKWGIYYYFEHSDTVHRMILVDGQGAHKPNPSAAYHNVAYYPPGHKINEEHANLVEFEEWLESGKWVTSEFDFKQPKADLKQQVDLPRNTGHNQLEQYQWPNNSFEPHKATDPEEGRFLTRIRMEEAGCLGLFGQISGNLRGMVCGHTFTLNNYPQHKYNDQSYLIVSSSLSLSDVGGASGEGQYACHNHVQVISTEHVFRPPRNTPHPRTTGPQTAIVTGPPGEEIYTDPYGRVKLSFHWNRECSKDQNSSCWVRVSSPWAGSNFGGVSLPRIGQEVIVDFENGDPERPIVTGRVYNEMNKPPWDLPGSKTQSGILSRSTLGGGYDNANALRFEDKMGQEEVWLHAEKDQRIEVENNESHWVGNNRKKNIDKNETTVIGENRTETVKANHHETIIKNRTVLVTEGHQDNLVRDHIHISSTENSIYLTAKNEIRLGVGTSYISITPDKIFLWGEKIYLNGDHPKNPKHDKWPDDPAPPPEETE